MTDTIVICLIVAAAVYSFRKVGIWPWFLICFGALVGLGEVASLVVTEKTLTQTFWSFHQANPAQGWLLIAMIGLASCILMVHLAWKQIWRKS